MLGDVAALHTFISTQSRIIHEILDESLQSLHYWDTVLHLLCVEYHDHKYATVRAMSAKEHRYIYGEGDVEMMLVGS
jgi:hypothetical protein